MRVVMLLLIFIYSVSSIYAQPNTKANEPKRSVAVKKTDITALPAKAKRFALIVGIDSYQSNQLTKLGGAVNDAKALAETLEVYAGFPKEQIYLLTSPTVKIGEDFSSTSEANRSNILRTLAIIRNSIPRDGLLLVAFSCHGMQRDKKSDKVYILPSDAQTLTTDLLEDTALNVEKLKERVLATGVGQVIFLVDACRNDPEAGKGESDNILTKDYLKAFSFNYDEKNKDVDAFATFFASSEGERAYEDPDKKQGYFTYALIEGLKGAAANLQGEVTLINLKSYLERVVPAKVKSSTGQKQIPRIEIGGYQSENLVLSVVDKKVNTSKPKMETESEVPLGTLIITVSRRDMEILVDKEVVAKSKAIGEKITIRNVEAGRPIEVIGRVKGEKDIVEIVELISRAKTEINLGKIVIGGGVGVPNNATVSSTTTNNTSALLAYKPAGTAVAPLMRSYSYETVELDGRGNIKSKPKGQASYYEEDLGSGIKLEMVEVMGSSYMMGNTEGYENERPQHKVRVPTFYMGKYEVTQGQWKAIMEKNPSGFTGDENLPVENVSWNDAVEFCKKLSEKTGREYRLPSEAEWEYAARGGTTTEFGYGETINANIVNYDGNYPYGGAAKGEYRRKTVRAGSLPPNGYGLYEMHGNVWEWCQDIYQSSYIGAPEDGRAWEKQGTDNKYRVLRGGSWYGFARYCRSADRYRYAPDARYDNLGFRVVASARTLK